MIRASISGGGNLEDICPDNGSGVPSCGQANRGGDDNAGGAPLLAVPGRGVTTCDSTVAM